MPSASSERFDRAYYERFYESATTRVISREDVERLGDFVCSYLRHLDVPVRRVLDVGCGLGWWRPVIERHFPGAAYTGVELSAYLCQRYGWTRASIVDYRPRGRFDLVLCQGVLQYLGHRDARRAIENLARWTRGALYLEALTREDWERHCDRDLTDGDVVLRRAAWYRRALAPGFRNAGGGVFVSRGAEAVLYALEGLAD